MKDDKGSAACPPPSSVVPGSSPAPLCPECGSPAALVRLTPRVHAPWLAVVLPRIVAVLIGGLLTLLAAAPTGAGPGNYALDQTLEWATWVDPPLSLRDVEAIAAGERDGSALLRAFAVPRNLTRRPGTEVVHEWAAIFHPPAGNVCRRTSFGWPFVSVLHEAQYDTSDVFGTAPSPAGPPSPGQRWIWYPSVVGYGVGQLQPYNSRFVSIAPHVIATGVLVVLVLVKTTTRLSALVALRLRRGVVLAGVAVVSGAILLWPEATVKREAHLVNTILMGRRQELPPILRARMITAADAEQMMGASASAQQLARRILDNLEPDDALSDLLIVQPIGVRGVTCDEATALHGRPWTLLSVSRVSWYTEPAPSQRVPVRIERPNLGWSLNEGELALAWGADGGSTVREIGLQLPGVGACVFLMVTAWWLTRLGVAAALRCRTRRRLARGRCVVCAYDLRPQRGVKVEG